jgi:PAS domain S-box-containing protein
MSSGRDRGPGDKSVRPSETHHVSELYDFFENGAVALHLVGADGTILRANKAELALLGYHADEYVGRNIAEFHVDTETIQNILARLGRGERIDKYPARLRAKDGAIKHVLITSSANFRDGEFLNTRCFTIDITDQKLAEDRVRGQAQRDARQRLAAIVESSDDAIISKDLNSIIVTWNEAAERLFGYSADEAIGHSIMMLLPEDRQDEEREILGRIRRGERIDHYETIRRRKDGTLLDISLTVSPIKNDMGEVVGASKIARDIGERKRAEQQRELLLAELNHRVKNTLSTVLSIAQQSFSKGGTLGEVRDAFTGRIRALAQTHTRLAETAWLGVSLRSLIADELAPYSGEDGSDRIKVSGPAVELSPKRAVMLGMAFHELATNAAKHGALSSTNGSVEVSWRIEAAQRVVLHWVERGGPLVAPPKRSGFGTFLLQRVLPADLGASLKPEYYESGLRCEIIVPLNEPLPQASA